MYIPNNIKFRIISSGAIAKFKQNQAFDFNEITNAKNFKFGQESKEILLLNYDVWFRTIMKLERLFVRTQSHDSNVDLELIKHIHMLFDDSRDEIDEVLNGTPQVFTDKFRHILCKTHKIFIEYLYISVKDFEGENSQVSFPKIVNLISSVLHNLLLQLHEIEELYKDDNRDPFLSYTNECTNVINKLNKFPVNHRAKLYKQHFDVSEFYIKNYADNEVKEICINKMLDNDIKITGVKTSNH